MYLSSQSKKELKQMIDEVSDTLVIQNEILEHAQMELNKIVNYLNECENAYKGKGG